MSQVQEPARSTPVWGEYDVVVLGGGPAGIAAAVAAARGGARTILVERHGFLGGMATAAGVTNFCGLHGNVHGEQRRVVLGVARDLTDRLARMGALNTPHLVLGRILAQAYDNAAFKVAADDLIGASGAELLFHAMAVGCIMDGGRIDTLLVETKSGRFALRGGIFIDCSGDGDLAAWSGARWERAAHLLFPTTMFRVGGVDPARAGEAWRTIPQAMAEAERRGVHFPRRGAIVRPQKNPTEWRVNVTQIKDAEGHAIDGTDARALSEGEVQGRSQIGGFVNFLRTQPGFEAAYLLDVPPQIGIRETRRIVGEHVLTEAEVLECADFDDTIGVNAWPLELHVAGDVEWRWQRAGGRGFNHLPWRMLLAQGPRNLLVAGRCGSMTHEAQSAARVTGGCFVMGQAAGCGAALALRHGEDLRRVPVDALQARLIEDGAYLGRPGDRLEETT